MMKILHFRGDAQNRAVFHMPIFAKAVDDKSSAEVKSGVRGIEEQFSVLYVCIYVSGCQLFTSFNFIARKPAPFCF